MTTLLRVQMLTNTLVQFALTSSIIPTPADPAHTHFVGPVFDALLPQIHKIRSALFVGNISMSVFQIMVRIMTSVLYDRPSVAVIRSTEVNCSNLFPPPKMDLEHNSLPPNGLHCRPLIGLLKYTRIHSSRMRTARFSGRLRGRGVCLVVGVSRGLSARGCLPRVCVCVHGVSAQWVYNHPWTQRQTPPLPIAWWDTSPREQNDRQV